MEERPSAPPVPWHRQPLWLGLLGLALMLAGWKLSTFVPMSDWEAEQAARLSELRGMAEDHELKEVLNRVARNVRHRPPYELPGRLVVFAGLALFVLAGVRMYRQPHLPAEGETRTSEEGPITDSR